MASAKVAAALEKLKKGGVRIYTVETLPEPEHIKTGSLMLDKLLGGGLETRRLTQFFGRPGCYKSVMSYCTVNNALKQYPESVAVILDLECRFAPEWASKFIDPENMDRIVILREEYVENAGNSINSLLDDLKGLHISIIVIDSIAAANTARYDNKDMKKAEVAGASMGISKLVRALVQIADKGNTAVLVLNQLRDDLNSYGPSIGRTNGGYQLKHSLNNDVYFRTLSQTDTKSMVSSGKIDIKDELGENQQIAVGVAFKIMKGANWSSSAKTLFYRKATENNDFGFDIFTEVINIAVANGVIKVDGASYIHPLFPYDEKKKINKITDKKPMVEFLKANPEIFEAIKNELDKYVEIVEEGTTAEYDDNN